MTDPVDPLDPTPRARRPQSRTPIRASAPTSRVRAAAAVVLAVLALVAAWIGGFWFMAFWFVAAIAGAVGVAAADRRRTPAGAAGARRADASGGRAAGAAWRPAAGADRRWRSARSPRASPPAARGRGAWAGAGVFYAAAILAAPMLLRASPAYGLRGDPVAVRRRLGRRHLRLLRRPADRRAEAVAPRLAGQDLVGRGRRHAGRRRGRRDRRVAGGARRRAARADVLARRRRLDRRPDRRSRRIGDEAPFRRQGFERA